MRGRINMLPDEMGMQIDKAQTIASKIHSFSITDNQIENDLEELYESLKNVYSSNQSSVLNQNNMDIINGFHTNGINLKSYHSYIQKSIQGYKKVGGEAVTMSGDLLNQLNGRG